jgi:hypothetical protein
MGYIINKIIHGTKYEKMHIYFKNRVVGGIFCGE